MLCGMSARLAAADDARSGAVVEVAGGALLFPDDGVVREAFVGGVTRIYVMPRMSIGPEIAYVAAAQHSHLMITGNVMWDLVAPAGGSPRVFTPFAVVGGGLFRTSEPFPRGDFSHVEGAFTAGGGVRGQVSPSVFVGVEARVGWELHVRVNVLLGIDLGRLRPDHP